MSRLEAFSYVNRLLNKVNPRHYPWYLDWWINWLKTAPVPIKFVKDDSLLFSHPLAYCNLVVDGKRHRLGFDMWDKYHIFADIYPNNKASKRWTDCIACFKTNLFDAKKPYRYRGPVSYESIEDDKNREKVETAYHSEKIFPAGMPLLEGKYFGNGWYLGLRSGKKKYDVNVSGSKKDFTSLRKRMVELAANRFHSPGFMQSYPNYLAKLSETKICIDFPSNSRVTFRSSEALAMGSLLIGPPTCNVYPLGLDIEECMVTCESDLSDFLEKIDYYLEHDAKREKIAAYGMGEWDQKMSPERISRYWVETAIKLI